MGLKMNKLVWNLKEGNEQIDNMPDVGAPATQHELTAFKSVKPFGEVFISIHTVC